MANRLQHASSPYLRQHADNPVDWHEWSDEAFERARAEDKPVFLSVGYSSCHWCHVMAHESFEDAELAAALNERFVSIKVDREERPDIDSVYMGAVQAMTGQGGWPMSVFLTPDGVPFFAGTYWPRATRAGMPGFEQVLEAVHDAWSTQRDKVMSSGEAVAAHLRRSQETTSEDQGQEPGTDLILAHGRGGLARESAERCVRAWDERDGGFGQAPKFPQAMTIDFLLAHHLRTGDEGALRAATHSLERMARGGIYDHVAGGFARYSTDAVWHVPHFEKMLYDNALLLRAYTHGAVVTGDPLFRRIATETAAYLLREMRHEEGGFYSATDADSEGVEGRFFVWDLDEFREVVTAAGEDPEYWAPYYDVRQEGNWESSNILRQVGDRDESDEAFGRRVDTVRRWLYERREQRVHPGLDDKILTSWNALAVGALAEAGALLGDGTLIAAATQCATFLGQRLVVDGRLYHTWKDGHGATVPAFLEDVAYLAQALLVLYEADPDPTWVSWARELAVDAEQRFADGETGTYFATAADAEPLLTRPKELWDNATPAGSSVMADVHLRLAGLTGDPGHDDAARRVLRAFAPRALQAPTGYGELLRALERLLAGPQEVAIVGPAEQAAELIAVYRQAWRPGSVLAVGTGGSADIPLLADRGPLDGRAAAYVCERFVCQRPVDDPGDLRAALHAFRGEG